MEDRQYLVMPMGESFRIIPEIRILRPIFCSVESQPQNVELGRFLQLLFKTACIKNCTLCHRYFRILHQCVCYK